MKVETAQLDRQELEAMGVFSWPVWTKENSHFDWYYDQRERCYLTEGKAEITVGSDRYTIQAGDFVTFPQGMSCIWRITEPVRKHYSFG